jgi:RNA polymerase sigma factor (sigma-70 family)
MDSRPTATNPHATNPPEIDLVPEVDPVDLVEDSPLRRFIRTLEQPDEFERLLRSIRVYVSRAEIAGEQSVAEIALEVFQDVVVEALRGEARYDAERNPVAWLLGIASNVVKRRREKLFRRRKGESTAAELARADTMSEEDIFEGLLAANGSDPSKVVLSSMGLESLLAHLAPADRRLIELDVVFEMNAAEVGGALGITAGNVRVRRNRILTRLRNILSEQGLSEQEKLEQEAGREEMHKDE